jgi:hypothetical protein
MHIHTFIEWMSVFSVLDDKFTGSLPVRSTVETNATAEHSLHKSAEMPWEMTTTADGELKANNSQCLMLNPSEEMKKLTRQNDSGNGN